MYPHAGFCAMTLLGMLVHQRAVVPEEREQAVGVVRCVGGRNRLPCLILRAHLEIGLNTRIGVAEHRAVVVLIRILNPRGTDLLEG